MINLNHKADNLVEAFRLDGKAAQKVLDFFFFLHTQVFVHSHSFSWAIGRIWIDELLSDNEKAYLIFSLGRLHETKSNGKEE